MKTITRSARTQGEVWMEISDKGRRKLATIMAIQEWSARGLAQEVGWRSHTILLDILSGKRKTIKPERATAIAAVLGVGMDELFMPRMSTDAGRSAHRRVAA